MAIVARPVPVSRNRGFPGKTMVRETLTAFVGVKDPDSRWRANSTYPT
jgi:hypothetical protein